MLLSHFLVNLSTTNIDKVVSMPNMRWLNFLFQPNISVETTLGHQHWIDVILSTLFCQHWNNVDKHVSAQLSFSTKFQLWKNVGSLTLNWCNSINLFQRCFANVETTPINVRRLNFHFQINISVDVFAAGITKKGIAIRKLGEVIYYKVGQSLLQSGKTSLKSTADIRKWCIYHKVG